VHLSSNSFTDLEFPIITTALIPSWTVEFYLLFQKTAKAGNIISITNVDGSSIMFEEDGSNNINYKLTPATGATVTELAFNR